MKGDYNMGKLTTGIVLGGVIGISSLALMNMDRRDMRRVQKKGKRLMNKAEDLMDDLKGFM